jgi:hypothetical protein
MPNLTSILGQKMGSSPSKKPVKKFEIGKMCALENADEYRRAKNWFDALSESDKVDWLNIARSERFIDAWSAYKSRTLTV